MTKLVFENASLLFPTRRTPKTQENGEGVGANFVQYGKKVYIASVDGLSLELQDGDRVAVIGVNGSGKSTLLRLASGIFAPTSGEVLIEGRPATLFSPTVGLSPEASAVNNIRDAARLMGVPEERIEELAEEVIEFAELHKFAHLPMRTYSNGMRARIGFGLATCYPANILLIDEIFGAGDKHFQAKAQKRMESFMHQAGILMMANHSYSVIKRFCRTALWMHRGKMKGYGELDDVLKEYKFFNNHD